MSENIKTTPYGIANFELVQTDNRYYVDKTHFIPIIENNPNHIFFIRPRRFGKSLWLSIMESYYDINKKEQFETLFKDTYIGKNPTKERNSYMILYFNFSGVDPDIDEVRQSFKTYCNICIDGFTKKYKSHMENDLYEKIISEQTPDAKLNIISRYNFDKKFKIYLLIDEYDNFANNIIVHSGKQAYQDLTHGPGLIKYFFNVIKLGTTGSDAPITRSFITGVSPVTMDDITSGHNIGKNLSLESDFNDLLGFTENEVWDMLSYYKNCGLLELDIDFCMNLMCKWYDHYRFSKNANYLYNSDMVLYFIDAVLKKKEMPEYLIDKNIRVDYEKLRHLLLIDHSIQLTQSSKTNKNNKSDQSNLIEEKLNGNFSILHEIMQNGRILSYISDSFPLEKLTSQENFVSLLFYFGLLSIESSEGRMTILRTPNLTVTHLMYSYMRDAFSDINVFRLDLRKLNTLVHNMAYHGDWKAFFEFLQKEVKKQTSIRDFLSGEKVIQTFLLAYINICDYFLAKTEQDMNKGFSDLYLAPFVAKYPDMKFSYLIELKYISKTQFEQTKLDTLVTSAKQQALQYIQDESVTNNIGNTTLKTLVIVYKGWELCHFEEISD